MKYFSRLVLTCAVSSFTVGGLAFAASGQHVIAVQDVEALLGHSSQSYLGVACGDVDNDRAAALKLKEATGAEIINVDRDAPASKAGLRPHDVILQMNGQAIAGEEQLRRMLRETPAGRIVTFLISRDGQQQTVSVKLADRATIEQSAWSQRMIVPAPDDDGDFVLEGPSGSGLGTGSGSGNGFFGVFSLGSPSVGVELDVLGSELADYFGVKDGQGLLVKHVAENSPASRAGLKAGDVITKANGQTMATLGEWMKMLHANRRKQVQVTLIRNHKEQTVTLEAESSKNRGELIVPNKLQLSGNGDLAWINNQTEPETLMLQVQPSVDMQYFQKQNQIQVQPSMDMQYFQKQNQIQPQEKIEILDLDSMANQME
jgi:serine protease Do